MRDARFEIRDAGYAKPVVRAEDKLFELPVVSRAEGPQGRPVTFAFDWSPDTNAVGYKLYYGATTNFGNVIDLGFNNVVTLTNVTLPIHAAATAYNADGDESVFSNFSGVLGEETVASIFAQTNTTPDLSGWTDAFAVQSVTNPPADVFYRLRIERTSRLISYP